MNGTIGYVLAFYSGEPDDDESFTFSFGNQVFRLALGALSMAAGILKLLSPVNAPGNFPVIGDLFPALANLAGGFILVFEYYRAKTTISTEASEKLGEIIVKNRKLAGFICLAAALLHLVFYPVLFL